MISLEVLNNRIIKINKKKENLTKLISLEELRKLFPLDEKKQTQ